LIGKLLIPVIFAFFLIYAYIRHRDIAMLAVLAIIYAILAALWILMMSRLSNWMIKLTIKAFKKEGKLPFGGKVILQFDDEGIFEKNELAESKVKYGGIERIVETSDMIYIYIGAAQAFILPSHVFESETQKLGFLKFIADKR
jgi:hypothetical protein